MNKNPIAFRVISIRTTGAALPSNQSPAFEHRELMGKTLNYSMRSQGQILRKVRVSPIYMYSLTHCDIPEEEG